MAMSTTPPAPHRRSIWHNPWLWLTAGLAVVAIGLGVWGAREQSKADDAKAALAAQEVAKATPTPTPTPTVNATQTPAAAEPTQSPSSDEGARTGVIAAVLAAARKALNDTNAQVDDLEAEVDDANAEADKASAEADKAKQDAEAATKQANDTSDAQKKADAEAEATKAKADQAQAEKRQLGAKAKAAAACAKSMLEIVGEIPSADNVDAGLQKAATDITALVPKCQESVASAGG